MTRESAKANLIAIGITEPTKEQIDSYLNQFNGEIQKDKDKDSKTQSLINDLSAQIKSLNEEKTALENKGLSDAELMKKDLETLKTQLADRDRQIANTERRAKLSALGIQGEQLDKFFTDDGTVDFDNLGQIIASAKESAATAKEAELAGKAGSPKGGSNGGNTLSDAEKFVTNMAKPANVGESIKSYL